MAEPVKLFTAGVYGLVALPFNATLLPEHIPTSPPALAVGKGFIVTVALPSGPQQPDALLDRK